MEKFEFVHCVADTQEFLYKSAKNQKGFYDFLDPTNYMMGLSLRIRIKPNRMVNF